MKTVSYDEYLTMPAEERLKYGYTRSVALEVIKKGIKSGRAYTLNLKNACFDDKVVDCIEVNDVGDIYALINGDMIYSEDWTQGESMQLMEIARKAKVLQAKDQWNNPIDVGSKVIFIENNTMVKAVVTNIELSNSEGGCKIYLTDFEVGVSYCADSPSKVYDLVKYKKPYTLVII